jgi:hypothetical protein
MNIRTDATLTQTDATVRFKGHLFASVRQLRQSLIGLATVADAPGRCHLVGRPSTKTREA